MCTCKFKYSFSPYTGCDKKCLYCYVTYIKNFWNVREKKDLIKNLEKEIEITHSYKK